MNQNIFPFFLNKSYSAEDRNRIIIGMADMMQHVYNTLDDRSRPVFYMMYESFIAVVNHNANKDYKSIHSISVSHSSLFTLHSSLKTLLTLEKRVGDKWSPADIFFQDTTKADNGILTPHQALAASLNLHGNVNLPYMEQRCQLDRYDIVNQLHDLVFFNPINGAWEEADKWLSGNIVKKLSEAEESMPRWKDGELEFAKAAFTALEGVKPMRIAFEDIDIQLGSRWVPIQYYEDFIYYLMGTDRKKVDRWDRVKLLYSPASDEYVGDFFIMGHFNWKVSGKKNGEVSDMVLFALTGKCPEWKTTIYDKETGKEKTVRDDEACDAAIRIITEIRQEWKEFICRTDQSELRKGIENEYNDRFNCEVRPQFDGSFQTFPDLRLDNLGIPSLYKSQMDAIWMIKRNGGGVCWHEVGTGKTLIMCISAYEMKRIGACNKPLIIGLKANIAQIAETFRKAYPNAKVLFPTQEQFSKKNRIELFNQIKNNDWDCIIMSHDQFGFIPQARETELRLMQEEIEGLDDILSEIDKHRMHGRFLTGLQKRRDNLRIKMLNLQKDLAEKKDDVMDFSEMGIDHILVDESHYFKNLKFATRNERVAGIGNPEGSQRSWKLFTAIRDIQYRKNRDICSTLLSGTIVSNSLTELYVIFKYLRPRALAEQNIHSFDAWAAVYCEIKTDYEPDVATRIRPKERFATYVNLPELSKFLNQITDYRTSKMCGIDAPTEDFHFVQSDPTPGQQIMIDRLLKFVASKKWSDLGIKRDCPANLDKALMLTTTHIARQVALDPRLLDDCRSFGDEMGNKVRKCAENVYRIYNETSADLGTQMIFSDFSTYDPQDKAKWNIQSAIRDVLVNEYHVPAKECAMVGDCTTDGQRLALFDRMNRGEVRILFGSTQKLGTGVNAQQRIAAIHHIDIPWKPSDLEQRNGRGLRKGNELAKKRGNKVDVFMYATNRTLDVYKFSLLRNKQAFIDQLNNGTLGVRRIDESVLADGDKAVSYAEFLSLLSGNQDLLVKARLDAKIMALEKEKSRFYRERNQAAENITRMEAEITTAKQWVAKAKYDYEQSADVLETTIPLIYGKNLADQKEVGKELYNIDATLTKTDYTTFGECGSLKLAARAAQDYSGRQCYFYIIGRSGQYYKSCMSGTSNGHLLHSGYEAAAQYAYATRNHITRMISEQQELIASHTEKIPHLREFTTQEWKGKKELADLYRDLETVRKRIDDANKPKEDAAA